MSIRDVIIIGAGPSGLATAIALKQLGIDYLVLEKGTLVETIRRLPTNMVFLTTPELMEIGGMPLTTPYEKPTRQEALQYYRKVTDAYQLEIALHEEVLAVQREGDIFVIATRGERGRSATREARAVVLAMGYYDHPNLLGVPGEHLPHVSHYYDEAHRYYRRRVVIVGGKNSAVEAALELYRTGAEVTLVHRGAAISKSVKYWVKPDIENRIKEGSVAARFNTRLVEIRPTEVVVETTDPDRPDPPSLVTTDVASFGPPSLVTPASFGEASEASEAQRSIIPADSVLLLTGYQADPEFLRRAGIVVNPETHVPRHDPLTFETNVPNLFIAGGQLAGKKTGTVFIENGRFHGARIASVLATRLANPPISLRL